MNLSRKQKAIIGLVLSVFLIVFLEIMISNLSRHGLTPFNGAVFAMQVAICLLMLRIHPKYGGFLANSIILIDLLYLVFQLVFQKRMYVLPGVANCLVFTVSIFNLSRLIQRKQSEILTDELTGLLNNRGLNQYIQDKIDSKSGFFVIDIELKDFSLIHGNYGHELAEKVLVTIGSMISEEIGRSGKVARVNSAEFIIVVDSMSFPREKVIDYILQWNKKKISIMPGMDPIECYQKFNVGIVESSGREMTCEEILSAADIAKYNAGKKLGTHYEFYDPYMKEFIEKGIEMEKIIHRGLDGSWFYMMYQPQYTLAEKKLRGFESLIRMKTPDGKFVSPGEFIPVAEKTDLIMLIDEYVINQVMADLREYVLEHDDVVVSVNVSAKNISKSDFADRVIDLLKKHDFPAKNLEVEITEYCIMNSIDITLGNIEKLHAAGVQIALDDFGTGYSSLSYLTKIPVDLMKIDKSLVDEIEKDESSLNFVKSVVTIGHGIGCEVICEGVEAETQLDLLKKADVDFIQGYVWGKPLMLADAKNMG